MERFLGVLMALTITGAYLGLVALFCALCQAVALAGRPEEE